MSKRIIAGIALCIGLATSSAADVVIVVNKANASVLDSKVVQRIFLGKEKKFSDGNTVTPINQTPDAQARVTFDETVLGRNSSQVSAYWSKLVFTGKGVPPKELANDQAVIDAVAADPTAIAYIDAASATDAVTVITLN